MFEVILETKQKFYVDKDKNNREEYLPLKKLIYPPFFITKKISREFPGGLVVRILGFHCHGPGFNSWSGNWEKRFQYLSQWIYLFHTTCYQKKKIHFSRRIYYTTPWVRIWPGGEWAKRKKKQIKFKTGLLSGCISQHSNYKNTVVILVQSCPTLCDPMDCSPPGSSVHGIFQARILEWVATSFSRGSSWPRDETHVSVSSVSCIGKWIFFFFFFFLPLHYLGSP